jgi:hypothetical protein
MRRIKLVLGALALVVAMFAAFAGPAMADNNLNCRDAQGNLIRCDGQLFAPVNDGFNNGFFLNDGFNTGFNSPFFFNDGFNNGCFNGCFDTGFSSPFFNTGFNGFGGFGGDCAVVTSNLCLG